MINHQQLIKHNFSKAARTYLLKAKIQATPALEILKRLRQYYKNGMVLDLGSGPGTLQHNPSISYPTVAFDLSMAMLEVANNKYKVNGDASNLPFATNSFPLIISNLMIQWLENKTMALQEIHRVLAPSGKLIITTLVKPSLNELQQAWGTIDNKPHTLNFLSNEDYLCAIRNARFKIVESLTWQTTIYLPTLSAVFSHFKTTGTNLAKSQSNIGLSSRKQIQQLERSYQKLATNYGLPLTYTFLLVVAKKEAN